MKAFLEVIAERLVKKFPDSMEEVAVVLPSKRSVVFLKSYLSKLIDKPIFLPQFFSIEEFIEKLSGYKVLDNLSLQFYLYEAYLKNPPSQVDSFEKFMSWSSMLLHDFNEVDRNLVSMLLLENFPSYIIHNTKIDDKKKLKLIANINNNFSLGDKYDYFIYIHQYWDLYELNGILKCAELSQSINSTPKYKFNKYNDIKFSSLINKSSLEYLNYKNLDIINEKFNIYNNSHDHIDICNIITTYLLSKDTKVIEKGIDIMKTYNLNIDNLDKIFKYSKYENKGKTYNTIKKLLKTKL